MLKNPTLASSPMIHPTKCVLSNKHDHIYILHVVVYRFPASMQQLQSERIDSALRSDILLHCHALAWLGANCLCI